MDRVLSKGPLGLATLWLQLHETCASKNEHDRQKFYLSQADKQMDRQVSRTAFCTIAAAQGGIMQQIVEAERAASLWKGDEPIEFKEVKLVAATTSGSG